MSIASFCLLRSEKVSLAPTDGSQTVVQVAEGQLLSPSRVELTIAEESPDADGTVTEESEARVLYVRWGRMSLRTLHWLVELPPVEILHTQAQVVWLLLNKTNLMFPDGGDIAVILFQAGDGYGYAACCRRDWGKMLVGLHRLERNYVQHIGARRFVLPAWEGALRGSALLH